MELPATVRAELVEASAHPARPFDRLRVNGASGNGGRLSGKGQQLSTNEQSFEESLTDIHIRTFKEKHP
jgi:hypothetical protein